MSIKKSMLVLTALTAASAVSVARDQEVNNINFQVPVVSATDAATESTSFVQNRFTDWWKESWLRKKLFFEEYMKDQQDAARLRISKLEQRYPAETPTKSQKYQVMLQSDPMKLEKMLQVKITRNRIQALLKEHPELKAVYDTNSELRELESRNSAAAEKWLHKKLILMNVAKTQKAYVKKMAADKKDDARLRISKLLERYDLIPNTQNQKYQDILRSDPVKLEKMLHVKIKRNGKQLRRRRGP